MVKYQLARLSPLLELPTMVKCQPTHFLPWLKVPTVVKIQSIQFFLSLSHVLANNIERFYHNIKYYIFKYWSKSTSMHDIPTEVGDTQKP